MPIKVDRIVTYLHGFLLLKSHEPLIAWSCEMTWETKIFISSLPRCLSMVTKLGKMVIYIDEFVPIESHNPLVMWSYKITWQTKIFIVSLPQCLWPPNLASWWLTIWPGLILVVYCVLSSQAITCPVSKDFQILYTFAQIFLYSVLFCCFFLPFFSKKFHALSYFLEQALIPISQMTTK